MTDEHIGRRFAALRAERTPRWPQHKLAAKAKVHTNTVCKTERTGNAELATLRKLAAALDHDLIVELRPRAPGNAKSGSRKKRKSA